MADHVRLLGIISASRKTVLAGAAAGVIACAGAPASLAAHPGHDHGPASVTRRTAGDQSLLPRPVALQPQPRLGLPGPTGRAGGSALPPAPIRPVSSPVLQPVQSPSAIVEAARTGQAPGTAGVQDGAALTSGAADGGHAEAPAADEHVGALDRVTEIPLNNPGLVMHCHEGGWCHVHPPYVDPHQGEQAHAQGGQGPVVTVGDRGPAADDRLIAAARRETDVGGLASSRWRDPCRRERRAPVGRGPGADSISGDPFVVFGTSIRPDAGPDRALQPAQWAAKALREGRFQDAAESYAEYLSAYPDDSAAMRLLAVALLLDAKTKEGIELMGKAYDADPSLASAPLSRDVLPAKPDALRKAVNATVAAANRTNTARAWLAASVLMQAEGRDDQAARMLARAAERGLDAGLVREFKVTFAK